MRPVHGRALALMNRHRVAVRDMVVMVEAERDAPRIVAVQPNGDGPAVQGLDGPEAAVADAHAAVIALEGHALATGEGEGACRRGQGHVRPQSVGLPEAGAGEGIQLRHVAAQIGHDNLRLAGCSAPRLIPCRDHGRFRVSAGRMAVNHALRLVGIQCCGNLTLGELAGGGLHPRGFLTADGPDRHIAHAGDHGSECAARLDGLELRNVAHKNDLRAALGREVQQAFGLAGADHARLVHHDHILGAGEVATLLPQVQPFMDGPCDLDPDPLARLCAASAARAMP